MADWSAPAVDSAQAVVAVAGTNTARWAAAQTLLSAVADQVPYVPLFTEDEAYAVRRGLALAGGRITSFDLADGDWIFLPKPTA